MPRVYIDTSVIVALADPADAFHDASLKFVGALRALGIPYATGRPFMLEVAKAAELRGTEAALRLVKITEEHQIELSRTQGHEVWTLLDEYTSAGVLKGRRMLDLLHYASATLLGCTHLASWDGQHFNIKAENAVNEVNASMGFTTLIVGDPLIIGRGLGIE